MDQILFSEHCAFKPHELGICIGNLIRDGVISGNERFLYYYDQIFKDEKTGKPKDDHLCTFYYIPDADDTKHLQTINGLCVQLLTNKEMQKECRPEEGIGVIINNEEWEKFKDDKRTMVIRLDDKKTHEYLSQCVPGQQIIDDDSITYDKTSKYYFMTFRINENSIKQFNNNGIDIKKAELEMNFRFLVAFVEKYFPEMKNEIKYHHWVIDTEKTEFDERDNVNRRYYKYCFILMDKDGNKIEPKDYSNTISIDDIDLNNLTNGDVVKLIDYAIKSYFVFEDDVVALIIQKDNMSYPDMILKNRTVDYPEEVVESIGMYDVTIVKQILSDESENKFEGFVIPGFEKISNNHELISKTFSRTTLQPFQIIIDK